MIQLIQRFFMALIITKRPTGLVFEKNISDILIVAGDAETSVLFTLKVGTAVAIQETYKFDNDGNITIAQLNDIISAYFAANKTVVNGSVFTTGLLVDVSMSFDINATSASDNEFLVANDFGFNFRVLHCDAVMPETLNAQLHISQNFLTHLGNEKRTGADRNEYLSYVHLAGSEFIILYKVYYISAGELKNKPGKLISFSSDSIDKIITFDTSLSAIRMASGILTDDILQYDIWFTVPTLQIESYAFTYMVDRNFYRNKINFIFTNSFGVSETFTATGTLENKISNEFNLSITSRKYRKNTQEFMSEKSVNTGFITESEMDWLNELIYSFDVKLYSGGKTEDIVLTSIDKKDSNTNELKAFKFSFKSANEEQLKYNNSGYGIFDESFDPTFN